MYRLRRVVLLVERSKRGGKRGRRLEEEEDPHEHQPPSTRRRSVDVASADDCPHGRKATYPEGKVRARPHRRGGQPRDGLGVGSSRVRLRCVAEVLSSGDGGALGGEPDRVCTGACLELPYLQRRAGVGGPRADAQHACERHAVDNPQQCLLGGHEPLPRPLLSVVRATRRGLYSHASVL